MGSRRTARELALKILYQADVSKISIESVLSDFWENHVYAPDVRGFAEDLVKGVMKNSEDIDRKIAEHATNWDFSRIAVIDRSILRLAVYEIEYRNDIPPAVSINEALEISKKYSTADSSRFINGVLDAIIR